MLNNPQDKLNQQVSSNSQGLNQQQARPIPQQQPPKQSIDTNPDIKSDVPSTTLKDPNAKTSQTVPEEKGFMSQLKDKLTNHGKQYLQDKLDTPSSPSPNRPQQDVKSTSAPNAPKPQTPQTSLPNIPKPSLATPKLKMPKMPKGFN